jgi:hypothetical protein
MTLPTDLVDHVSEDGALRQVAEKSDTSCHRKVFMVFGCFYDMRVQKGEKASMQYCVVLVRRWGGRGVGGPRSGWLTGRLSSERLSV